MVVDIVFQDVTVILMKLLDWQKILNNKYNYLLAVEILIVLAFPFLQLTKTDFPLTSMLLLLAITPALYVALTLKRFMAIIMIGLLAFILNIIASYQLVPQFENILLCLLALYAIYFLFTIVVLIRKISSRKVITSDTVKGGISVYFLIGLFWSALYMILNIIHPGALTVINDKTDYFYFSFTTLTTLGYGDITPTISCAKIMAIMEAFTGQIYIAIFIAQLIGLSIAQKLQENKPQS
ncbi:MAG TPA: two pore domain potassium channel family protein [Phycisphaerales bacterium]|nr:two pore domain potassium channel family protein [Phycisphaerales bacterium]